MLSDNILMGFGFYICLIVAIVAFWMSKNKGPLTNIEQALLGFMIASFMVIVLLCISDMQTPF